MNLSIPFASSNGDRKYTDAHIAELLASLLANGVLLSSLDALQVVAGEDWTVDIKPWRCIINGRIGVNTAAATLNIAPSPTGSARIDRIALRCDYVNRTITETVVQGTPAVNPIPPTLRNDQEAVDLSLAQVLVQPSDAGVTQSMITDERIFSQAAAPLDTEALLAQWDDQFGTWFNGVQGVLTDDAAGEIAQRLLDLEGNMEGCIYQLARLELEVGTDGWTQNAQGLYEKTVEANGTDADSQTQRVHYAVQGVQIGKVLLAGCRVDTDDTLTLVCLAQPASTFTLEAVVEDVRG